MTSFLARWGPAGVPRAIEAVWRADSRRLAQWTCRAPQRQQQQVRCYHEDAEPEVDPTVLAETMPTPLGLEDVYYNPTTHPDIETVIVPSPADVYTRFYSEKRSIPSRNGRIALKALEKLDYKRDLPTAMRLKNVDLTARCVIAASLARDDEFLQSISDEEFSSILQALAGEDAHIHRLETVHRGFGRRRLNQLDMRSTAAIAYEYARIIQAIYVARDRLNRDLSLQDYSILLRAARDLGQQRFSNVLWTRMRQTGHEPDTECWNAYVACCISVDGNKAITRTKNQAKPLHVVVREMRPEYQRSSRFGHIGRLETARRFHEQMLEARVAPNAASYAIMISAAAREGDLRSVETILSNVWGLDVERLAQSEDVSVKHRIDLDESSPLYPTRDLIVALVDAFCINRNLPKALKCVDYFAQHYNIDLDLAAWERVLEMTFVSSMPRYGNSNRELDLHGRHRADNVQALWNTMVGAPYSVKPTMRMYNYLIKSLAVQRRRIPIMFATMEEARPMFEQSMQTARDLQWELGLHYTSTRLSEDPAAAAEAAKLRDDYEYAELVRIQNWGYMKAWVKLLLGATNLAPGWGDYYFSIRVLPKFLVEWEHSVPTVVRYETEGGLIEFQMRHHDNMLASAERKDRILWNKTKKENIGLIQTQKVRPQDATVANDNEQRRRPRRLKSGGS